MVYINDHAPTVVLPMVIRIFDGWISHFEYALKINRWKEEKLRAHMTRKAKVAINCMQGLFFIVSVKSIGYM